MNFSNVAQSMAEPVKDYFKTIAAARANHAEYGGILLAEGRRFMVCHCLAHRQPCQCRDAAYIDQLAPTWDETRAENRCIVQDELF